MKTILYILIFIGFLTAYSVWRLTEKDSVVQGYQEVCSGISLRMYQGEIISDEELSTCRI